MAKPKAAGEELERLKRQIKNKEAGRLYFFFGEETFLLEYYLGQMKKLLLEELTEYNDGGTNLPNFYIVLNKKVIDLSGMSAADQIYSLAEVELAGYEEQMPLILAATNRTDT